MKVPSFRIESFVNKIDKSARIILVYGADNSIVRERATRIARQITPDDNDPFCASLLSGSDIAANPTRLHEEMMAQSLTGGRRLVRIQHATDSYLAAALEILVKEPPSTDTVLIIEAGELDKKSRMRAICDDEQRNYAWSVACYHDEPNHRSALISTMLKAEGLDAPKDILQQLAASLPLDRDSMRQEITKLALGKSPLPGEENNQGRQSVSMADIRLYIDDGSDVNIDDLTRSIMQGNLPRVADLSESVFATNGQPVMVLRALQRLFMRLHEARLLCDDGENANNAIKSLRPAVFWKDVEPMTTAIRIWTSKALTRALARLAETEAACKKTGMPDKTLCSQVFLQIAQYAAQR